MSIKPGTYYDLANEPYHKDDAINASFTKDWIKRSPMHAKLATFKLGQAAADTGSGAHFMALEPEKGLVVRGGADRRGNQWKHAKEEADAAGKLLLTASDYDKCEAMADALRAHPEAGPMLKHKKRKCEASVFALHKRTGQMLRCRPDIWIPGVLGDIKTCQDASPNGFKDIWKMSYFIQAAHYILTMNEAGHGVREMKFLAVEKEYPHCVHVHRLKPSVLTYGLQLVEGALSEIQQCAEIGRYPTGWPSSTLHDLPYYLTTTETDI